MVSVIASNPHRVFTKMFTKRYLTLVHVKYLNILMQSKCKSKTTGLFEINWNPPCFLRRWKSKWSYQDRTFQYFVPFSRSGVAFTYYGISLNITGFGLNPYLTQTIFASMEIPMKIILYFFLHKFGRRPAEVASLLLTGIFLFINIFVAKG